MLGSNPSAGSGARTEAGYLKDAPLVPKLRAWHHAINPTRNSLVPYFSSASAGCIFVLQLRGPHFEDMPVMKQSVQHRGNGSGVAE